MNQAFQDKLRTLPSVDELVAKASGIVSDLDFSRPMLLRVCRELVDSTRRLILGSNASESPVGVLDFGDEKALRQAILICVKRLFEGRYARVLNATGIMLHTGLGRAVLSDSARGAVMECAGPCLLEVDLETKKRSKREAFLVSLLKDMLGCSGALVVNNNAAAVFLALSGLAGGKEVIVSRGELVEIGGGFRVPDIMQRGGGDSPGNRHHEPSAN